METGMLPEGIEKVFNRILVDVAPGPAEEPFRYVVALRRWASNYESVTYGRGRPYLTRYEVSALGGDGFVYAHEFHRSDEDGHLHCHPWFGLGVILAGGYREERRAEDGKSILVHEYPPGSIMRLSPDTFHRVDLLDRDLGCWTLFAVGRRLKDWGFWDRETGEFEQWKAFHDARRLPEPTRGRRS